jgi:uncharacterized membrane protein
MRARKAAPFSFLLRWSWWAMVPLALAAVACALPWLMARAPEFGLAMQRGFSLVCHQRGERSFYLLGGIAAVCARCLGIYLGASVGLLVRVSRQVARRALIAAAAFNVVDGVWEFAGMHGNWAGTRFALGIALGMAGATLVMSPEPDSPLTTDYH